jgi:hypothetical protein
MTNAVIRLIVWLFGARPTATVPVAAEDNRHRLHIPQSLINKLRELTRPQHRPEPLAFLKARFASEKSRRVVVAIGVLPFPDEAYIDGPAGANFRTEWAIDLANAGIPDNVGCLAGSIRVRTSPSWRCSRWA